ncbi:MAG: hypothetical protein WCA81_15285 [Rhizomicrobium sp.]
MAEHPKSDDALRLVKGAERLERLARSLKDGQLARTRTKIGAQPPVSEAFVLSPDEAWAKKYRTNCIGPVCFPAAGSDLPAFAKFALKPVPQATSHDFSTPAKAAAPQPSPRTTLQGESGPIGLTIGKPIRPRSWLVRLLRGR